MTLPIEDRLRKIAGAIESDRYSAALGVFLRETPNRRAIAEAADIIAALYGALEAAVADSTGKPNVWFFNAKDALALARGERP